MKLQTKSAYATTVGTITPGVSASNARVVK